MAKVMTKPAVDALISGKIGRYPAGTTGGSVARASDIEHLRTLQQLRDGLALDDSESIAATAKDRAEAIARRETRRRVTDLGPPSLSARPKRM
jgi:hypothetical protein